MFSVWVKGPKHFCSTPTAFPGELLGSWIKNEFAEIQTKIHITTWDTGFTKCWKVLKSRSAGSYNELLCYFFKVSCCFSYRLCDFTFSLIFAMIFCHWLLFFFLCIILLFYHNHFNNHEVIFHWRFDLHVLIVCIAVSLQLVLAICVSMSDFCTFVIGFLGFFC